MTDNLPDRDRVLAERAINHGVDAAKNAAYCLAPGRRAAAQRYIDKAQDHLVEAKRRLAGEV